MWFTGRLLLSYTIWVAKPYCWGIFDLLLLDAVLRFSGLGLLILFFFFIIRDLPYSKTKWLLLGVILTTISQFLGFTPDIFSLPVYLQLPLRFIDIFQMIFIWLLALSLFGKDFKFGRFHILLASAYCFSLIMERFALFNFIDHLPFWWAIVVNTLHLFIVCHMILVALKERSDDLVELRRNSRVYLVLMTAFSAVSAAVFGSILFSNYQETITVISIWPAIFVMSIWLAKIEKHVFSFQDNGESKDLPARDQHLKEQLDREVIVNRLYLQNNLSIESLAHKLGVSEYRLRSFINKTLGYTNFSTYINHFRLKDIKSVLAQKDKNHIPILTIALDHGFSSLSPFNRAFKLSEGVTPSEYRKKMTKTS